MVRTQVLTCMCSFIHQMSTQHFVPSTLPGTGARKINKTSLLSLGVWKSRLRKEAELYRQSGCGKRRERAVPRVLNAQGESTWSCFVGRVQGEEAVAKGNLKEETEEVWAEFWDDCGLASWLRDPQPCVRLRGMGACGIFRALWPQWREREKLKCEAERVVQATYWFWLEWTAIEGS